jgi:hypothetical protein
VAVAGIDSHKDTLAVAVVDDQGRELDRTEIEISSRGHLTLIGWLGRHELTRVGIEGAVARRYMSPELLAKVRLEVIDGEAVEEVRSELVTAS